MAEPCSEMTDEQVIAEIDRVTFLLQNATPAVKAAFVKMYRAREELMREAGEQFSAGAPSSGLALPLGEAPDPDVDLPPPADAAGESGRVVGPYKAQTKED